MDKCEEAAAAEGEEGSMGLRSEIGGSCAFDCRGWLI